MVEHTDQNHRLQFTEILLVFLMMVVPTQETVLQTFYKMAAPGQGMTGMIGTKHIVKSKRLCAQWSVFLSFLDPNNW